MSLQEEFDDPEIQLSPLYFEFVLSRKILQLAKIFVRTRVLRILQYMTSALRAYKLPYEHPGFLVLL
jgi:hypothetical protein